MRRWATIAFLVFTFLLRHMSRSCYFHGLIIKVGVIRLPYTLNME